MGMGMGWMEWGGFGEGVVSLGEGWMRWGGAGRKEMGWKGSEWVGEGELNGFFEMAYEKRGRV